MRNLTLLSLLIVLLCTGLQAQNVILPFGSTWKYYDLGNEPPKIMGRNFEDATYNDSSWLTGSAQLGYGDGDEATVLTSPVSANNSLLAAYFRIDFNVNNPGSFDNYTADILYDDGAVVYLNGNEIGRVNMGNGDPGYFTFASSSVSNDNSIASFSFPSSALNVGNNVLVVEVHQASTTSSDLSFDASIVTEPPINRGPYLQKLTPSSVVVKWRTSSQMGSTVRFGLSPTTAVNSVTDPTLKTDHEVEITGLQPNRRYFYFLMNGTDTILAPSPDQYFITSPVHGTVQPVTAWILGDPGSANNNARAVRDAYYNYIGTDHTDMMLFLGDNAYNSGTDNEYQFAMFENMYEDKLKNTVSWSCLGNHDGFTAESDTQSGPYYDIFDFPTNGEAGGVASGTEAYYSFDYANIHFIVLESYETDRSVGGAMYNWALLDIQNTTQDWIVAFWHHPAYTKGSHNSDNEAPLIQMRQNFVPMLEQNGVDLVLSGHSHSYERSYFVNGHYGNSTTFNQAVHAVGPNGFGDGRLAGDGVYQKDLCSPGSAYITTGSASRTSNGPLDHPVFYYSARSLGSTIMEVNGDQMDIKYVRETGAIDDFFTIKKGNFNFPCDDGNPCTANDVIDASCNCVGTPVPPIDSDSDGTIDCLDECPNDPNKILPGICGCGNSDLVDTDADGTPDCLDSCPSDPAKISPGLCGCGNIDTPDTDGDGTFDCNDLCPNDPTKVLPGICGCGVSDTADNDADGTPNCNDQCPNDSNKVVPGICGCGVSDTVDNDADGTPNCNDLCPNDPTKVLPGICGCGVSDTADNDADGTPNCNDLCPNDPTKLLPGICGCGFSDTADADADGTVDCNDLCPNDPNKITPGICGCGISDITDMDGDGTIDCNDLCPNDPNKTSPGICGCGNIEQDFDQDGNCDTTQSGCSFIDQADFEMDSGIWTPGGIGLDAERVMSTLSPNGLYSMRIRDNSFDDSAIFSSSIDMSQAESFEISFAYQANGFQAPQSFFFEFSNDGGATFTLLNEWRYGIAFVNNVVYQETIDINPLLFSPTCVLKFRSNGNINADEIFLDDIQLEMCIEECQDHKVYSDNSFTQQSEKAIIGIETNRIVDSGSNLEHHAGEFVLMTEGFEVKTQGVFHAFIEACN